MRKTSGILFSTALLSAAPCLAFEPWVDPLPVPPRIVVSPVQKEITLRMRQFMGKIHRDFPEVPQWGYEGVSPGPTIEVEKGQPLTVHWINELPETHILPKPHGEMSAPGTPDVRAVVHLHGAAVSQPSITDKLHNNDGWPDLWLRPGEKQISFYPNAQDARTLWYHDHALGSTGRNVAAGLLGAYIIHDERERALNLPSGSYDIPLLLQPRKLKSDGSLDYVSTLMYENHGNSFFVNGKLYPYLEVEPRRYRFRVINGSNARSVAIRLLDASDSETPGPAFHQIGSDSGFLASTVTLNDPAQAEAERLVLMPAERADIVIDFSAYAGRSFVLHNNMPPDDFDGVVPLYKIMLFRVGARASGPDISRVPGPIREIPRLDPASAARSRRITFESMDMDGTPMLTHNGKMWHDPVTDFVAPNTTEIWELVNTLPDAHPFHVHLVDFQVLDRRPYDVDAFLKDGEIRYTGEAIAPLANEMGWKDTVRAPTGHVTRIILPFGSTIGHYIYHCHILEHEDMDMMRPFQIGAPGALPLSSLLP